MVLSRDVKIYANKFRKNARQFNVFIILWSDTNHTQEVKYGYF